MDCAEQPSSRTLSAYHRKKLSEHSKVLHWFLRLSPRAEADAAGLGFRWRHELADGVEYHLELAVVFLLDRSEFARQVPMRSQQLAQPEERPHDRDIDLDGTLALQNTGEHRHAMLGESIWWMSPPAPAQT